MFRPFPLVALALAAALAAPAHADACVPPTARATAVGDHYAYLCVGSGTACTAEPSTLAVGFAVFEETNGFGGLQLVAACGAEADALVFSPFMLA